MKTKDAIFAAAAALGGVAGAVIATRVAEAYRRDQRIALAQIGARGEGVQTPSGLVEYAEAGSEAGPAALVLHGAGGGFDQGLHCVGWLEASGLRFIAPSRFGYLGSPLPPNATPEAQADACAALLDALGVERACVLAFSAGGMSGAAFALRHPDRCWGLILASAIVHPVSVGAAEGQVLSELLLASDFPFWALSTYGEGLIAASVGIGPEDWERLSAEPEARRGLRGVMRFDPVTRRRDGLINDLVQADVLPQFPLERIAAPTLLIHGTADSFAPYPSAVQAAAQIPGAALLDVAGGGHLAWFTHAAQLRPAVLNFIGQHAPTPEAARKG